MYLPRNFAANPEQLLTAEAFGWIVVPADLSGETLATPVPFVRAENGDLLFHVARKNPLVAAMEAGSPAKLLVTGPHAYVSSSLYQAPDANVPTWNYVAAEVSGVLSVQDTPSVLAAMLAVFDPALTLSETVVAGLLPAIVGGRLTVTNAVGKAKLSQNRAPIDAARVAEALWRFGDFSVAAEMRRVAVRPQEHVHFASMQNACIIEEIDDEPALLALFPLVKTLRDALDEETFLKRVQNARKIGYRIRVVRDDKGNALAYAGFRPVTSLSRGSHIHLDDLVVREDARGTGIGAALLGHIETLAKEFAVTGDAATLYLDARPTALGFYEKQGYSVHPAPVVRKT